MNFLVEDKVLIWAMPYHLNIKFRLAHMTLIQ